MIITTDDLRCTVPSHVLRKIEQEYSEMLSIVNKDIREVSGWKEKEDEE